MTLRTVPRYDRDRTTDRNGRAVVIGAGMAGLLAARVLADAFEEVTVIERDPLIDALEPRRGVPQGNHVHVLLESGRATLEDLFPGYSEELRADGSVVAAGPDFHTYVQGGFLATTDRQTLHFATRSLYESVVRRRVVSIDRVDLRSERRFVDYLTDDDAASVEGVVVRGRGSEREELAADLVVDATGRTSRTPAWLERHGYRPPAVEEVTIDLAYASTFVDRPADDRRAFFANAEAPRTRGGFALPVEGDRWLVNLHGMYGDHPPTEPEGFAAFAASLPVPDVRNLLDGHPRTAEDVAFHPFPSSRRYRYEDLERFPDGLIVVGDAIASFNPVNGQGMSVAALEALALHRLLAQRDRRGLASRFFDAASDVVDVAWELTIGGDLAFPQADGPRPRGTVVYDWYLNRLLRRAHGDAWLSDLVWIVFGLERPPSVLFRPRVVWRVLGPLRRGGEPRPRAPPRDRIA